jgi:hypothetical protein
VETGGGEERRGVKTTFTATGAKDAKESAQRKLISGLSFVTLWFDRGMKE